MEAIKAGGCLKGLVCARGLHIGSVFVSEAKGPIRAPFCQWAAAGCVLSQAIVLSVPVCTNVARPAH